ncbi:uncharacterized protein LOC130147357 [Falco biarmicus]|uniref:uncharacterized protein LOC130147357 n=1 Tax=Falco biarmicus TaxID=345155 RepID=UPI0024BD5988|nr:uncharacterized protein LOC130147357 [Falco biarmicus]
MAAPALEPGRGRGRSPAGQGAAPSILRSAPRGRRSAAGPPVRLGQLRAPPPWRRLPPPACSDWEEAVSIPRLPQSPTRPSSPLPPLPASTSWEVGGWQQPLEFGARGVFGSLAVARSPSAAGLAAAELEAAGQQEESEAPSRAATEPDPGQREEPGTPSRDAGEPGPGQRERRPRPLACLSQMEASLTCAVCLSLFEEPVTLPQCSHNFCRDCVLECLASAEAARLQQQQRGQSQARLSRGGPGPGGGGAGARVSCPLCRKLCPLPRGGAAALPVNTTLAEVVKLYRSGTAGAAKGGEAEQGQGPGLLSPLALGGTCQKHPSRLVQLYCRMCRQAGCGQCVSEEHRGIFHSVNLIDTVYQEEKLTFFSSLKKMRIINEKLMNEISSQPNDTNMVQNNDAEIIALEFGEVFKTLELKKWQLLEEVENQRIKKEKEFQIWKKMKETHKKTIENFLKDCEKLVHECDPQRFLEVACGLNTRMKTQLDLMNIASSYEKPPEYTQKKMDIKAVVNEILALKLMPVNVDIVKDLPSGGNENSTKNTLFKSNVQQWQDQRNTPNTFLPVAGQEEALADGSRICTHVMSMSEMPAFQNMSHEELRYKYYMERQKLTNELKTQTLPANKASAVTNLYFPKDRSSGTPVPSPIKASDTDKVKMGTLQRAEGFERSFSETSNHSIPCTNMNFSETNGDLKSFHERSSKEVTTPALPENSKDLAVKEKLPMQTLAVVSNEMDTNSSNSSGLKPAESVAVTVSNSEFLDASAERLSASAFAFSARNRLLPRLTKDAGTFSVKKKDRKSVFPQFYLGKCDHVDKTDNQDESKFRKHGPVTKITVSDVSTSPNIDAAESEKPDFSFPLSNSERDCFAGSGVSNSFKVLPLSSFFSQSEKPSDKNTSSHMKAKTLAAKETAECGTQTLCFSWKQKVNASESITSVACSTSETTTAAGVNDVSESPLLPSNCVFSFKNNCFPLPSQVFSFGSIVRNTSDSLTSSVFLSGNGTEKMEKETMKSPDKTPVNLGKPVSSECAQPASSPKCEVFGLPMNSSKKTKSTEMLADSNSCSQPLCSVVLPVQNKNESSAQLLTTATKQETKVKDEESKTVAENSCSSSRKEDEPESVQFPNAAWSVPSACNDPSLGGSVLTVNEAGGMPSDSDSDTEELSQTSGSTDTSSASEYFSVAEDKISTRRKSET